MSNKQTRRLDGYVRVSKVGGRDGDSFISPQVQRERIQAAARNAGGRIVEWHTDLDESGGNRDRLGFQAALARVEAGATDGIVVAKLDRFARSVVDAREALTRIDAAGGSFISAEDGFDTRTPMGRFAVTILTALAELELERVKENWITSRRYAAERGTHMAQAPTGYDHDGKRRLVPNQEAPIIAEVFRRRAQGRNWSELARHLDAEGVRPAGRPDGNWTAAGVRALVSNRVYLGEIRAGDYVNTDAHLPIVTLAEFEAAQASHGSPVTRSTEPSLLAGLLRCASCRHVLRLKRINNTDSKVYRCGKHHGSGTCPAPATISASVIEPYLETLLLDQVATRAYRPEVETRALEEIEREVENAEAELHAWVTDEAILSLGRDIYVAGLNARQQRMEKTQARRRELLSNAATALPSRTELAALWPTLTNGEKRRLLSSAIDTVIIRPNGRRPVQERAVILLYGEAPTDMPGRGKRVPLRPFQLPEGAGMPVTQDRHHSPVEGPKRRRGKAAA
jgi:DNA invertase Pin-like site-specific DNA recombinase